MPVLQEATESGFNLGKTSKVMTFEDPTELVQALNSLHPNKDFEIYNAMQLALPLFGIRLNNSIGNLESNFKTDFNAVKDITIGTYENGILGIEKKTTLINGKTILQNITPEFENIIYKMLSTIPWGKNGVTLRVPEIDSGGYIVDNPTNFKPISTADWVEHGATLGILKIEMDGELRQVYAKEILNKIRTDIKFKDKFLLALELNKVSTGMVAVRFHNAYELWKYLGGAENIDSWDLLAHYMGNYTGIKASTASTQIHKFSETLNAYPLRDAYIEKVGFTSQKKEGQRHLMDSFDFVDPINTSDGNFINELGGRWDEIPNDGERVILNSMHSNDTTAKSAFLPNFDTGEIVPNKNLKDSSMSFLQQAYGSLISGLDSIGEVKKVETSLATLSMMGAVDIYSSVRDNVLAAYEELLLASENKSTRINDLRKIQDGFSKGLMKINKETDSELLTEALEKGYREYANKLLKDSIRLSQSAGTIKDFGTDKIKDDVSYSLKIISDYITGIVAQKFKENCISFKVPGGEQVLEANHHMMQLYTFGKRTDLTRSDLNEAVYFGVVLEDAKFAEAPLRDETVKYLTSNDYVLPSYNNSLGLPAKTPIKLNDIERALIIRRGTSEIPPEQALKDELNSILTLEGYSTKLEPILKTIKAEEKPSRDLEFMNLGHFPRV